VKANFFVEVKKRVRERKRKGLNRIKICKGDANKIEERGFFCK